MRPLLTVLFWIWAIAGLLFNGWQVVWAHGLLQLNIGTSAAITMDIALWTAGLIMFGIGAALANPELGLSKYAIGDRSQLAPASEAAEAR